MISDFVFFDEGDDVCGSEACEGGLCEVRIFREEVFRAAMDVGEVAAAASGDEDLLADSFGMVEQDDAAASAASFEGAHHASGACSEYYDIHLLRAHLLWGSPGFMMA